MKLYRLAFLFLLATLIAGEALADGGTVIIQVRTDLIPGVEFDRVRSVVRHPDGSTDTFFHAADPAKSYDLGVRALEVSGLPSGDNFIDVALMLGSAVLVERPVRHEIDDHFHWAWGGHAGGFKGDGVTVITVLLTLAGDPPPPPPLVEPIKIAKLEKDLDGSGTISPGDEVRYTIEFDAAHVILRGSAFSDVPSESTPLIPGSVTTTHGVVFRGNFPSDTDILINFDPILAGEIVQISYHVRVAPIASNQGVISVVTEGTDYPAFTDDPATQSGPDPTILSLACGEPGGPQCCSDLDICIDDLADCKSDRDVCHDNLGTCENTLLSCREDLVTTTQQSTELREQVEELERSLAELRDDGDADGVIAARDDCPGTSAGDPVDSVGCSQSQFCAAVPASGRGGQRTCRLTDWGNDEPVGNPRDCRPIRGRCVAY